MTVNGCVLLSFEPNHYSKGEKTTWFLVTGTVLKFFLLYYHFFILLYFTFIPQAGCLLYCHSYLILEFVNFPLSIYPTVFF